LRPSLRYSKRRRAAQKPEEEYLGAQRATMQTVVCRSEKSSFYNYYAASYLNIPAFKEELYIQSEITTASHRLYIEIMNPAFVYNYEGGYLYIYIAKNNSRPLPAKHQTKKRSFSAMAHDDLNFRVRNGNECIIVIDITYIDFFL
jgi:hypothetical protein